MGDVILSTPVIRALRAAAQLAVTVQREAQPPEAAPLDIPMITLSPVPLFLRSVRESITSYRSSLEAVLRQARATATNA